MGAHEPGRGCLLGRRILVAGGSAGIGAAVVRACSREGAAVAVAGRDPARLAAIAEETGALAVECDVTDAASTMAAVNRAAGSLGGLDSVVNSAGLMTHSRISDGAAEDWGPMVQVNLLGAVHVAHASLPHIRAAGGGDVIFMSSVAAGAVSVADFAVYAASKAGVVRLAEGLRVDLAGDDIRVSLVTPGLVRTDGFGPGIRDEQLRSKWMALRDSRGIEPEDVAAEIVHVLSAPRSLCLNEVVIVPHRPSPA